MSQPIFLFVYNADSGLVNALLDIGHKIVSPQTYACRLCAITHSTFHMHAEWRQFVQGLGAPVEFLHRDELARKYGIRGARLPAVYCQTDGEVAEWIGREEIERCQSLDDLKRLVLAKREAHG